MSAPSVLYDQPGPRAKQRNIIYTVLFVAVLAGVLWWALDLMNDAGQLEWVKWEPFFADGTTWTTYLLPGLQATAIAAGLAMVIALPIGAFFGIARMSDHRAVRAPAGIVVEFFRAVPVLLLMVFANEAYALFTDIERDVRPLYAVVTGLVLYNASVLAEVVRAGILALPKGQTEAALAVGMRKGQLMTNVLLPQSVTAMLPAIVSQLVVIVKDTALGGAILGYAELLNESGAANSNAGGTSTIAQLTAVAIVYIIVNAALTWLASWLERRMRRSKKSTGAVVGGGMVEEQAPGMHLTGGRSGESGSA
ncbi:amino acid ABC transporter permease [Actinophytocola xinjiangensis]|uniref:Amino acid ABC transporter permease n=1 Tax=Actinophytocola xinjiangensis TaxID=485602 RepID=A0A7Z1AUB6_9PSEU|nr:amino acid ABC transporter permease [Actinophytocola xinjiangensis]OLF04320.1 amino acid ABC transporter permease [Actinophytocola xinjiangensis]